MRVVWHHATFNAPTQVGFGEYTFALNNHLLRDVNATHETGKAGI